MTHSQGKTLLATLLVAVLGVAVLGRITDRGSSDGQLAWAQVAASSCGNAILEPGEQCDPPGSITCPPGSPADAFLACSANCTCPVLDHFQCYEVKPAFFSQVTVHVTDQFGTLTETLRYPHRLCAPANKNNEDPTAPSHPDHLTCYKTTDGKFPQSTHTIDNQFGLDDVTLIHRRELCVPSLKNPATTTTSTTSTTSTPTSTTTTSTTTTTTSTTSSTTSSSTTSTTTSTTTTTTLYGSPSRAFLVSTDSLLD